MHTDAQNGRGLNFWFLRGNQWDNVVCQPETGEVRGRQCSRCVS